MLGILWAYLVRFTAVALQSVQGGYARIPESQDEAARLLGSNAWGVLRRVHLPLLRGPVLAGLAGQTGLRAAREMPQVLAGLGGRRLA